MKPQLKISLNELEKLGVFKKSNKDRPAAKNTSSDYYEKLAVKARKSLLTSSTSNTKKILLHITKEEKLNTKRILQQVFQSDDIRILINFGKHLQKKSKGKNPIRITANTEIFYVSKNYLPLPSDDLELLSLYLKEAINFFTHE